MGLERLVGLTDRGRATGAAGLTLALAGTVLGFEELTRVGLVALAAVALGVGLVTISRPRVDIEAVVSGRSLLVGEVMTLPLRLTARRRSPSVVLEQPLPDALGGGTITAVVPSLASGRGLEVTSRSTLRVRGRHDIPPGHLVREDPFGFAARRHPVGTRRTVTVLPRVHDLTAAGVSGSGLRNDGSSIQVSPLPGDEFGSIRTYAPGDDLRRIHWPVTAHRGELMTRHDERTTDRHALLVLDPHLADRSAPAVLEWGIEMLASAAVALDRAGLTTDLLTGSASLVGGPGLRRIDEILLALAMTPTRMRPPRLGVAVEDPFVGLVREAAARAGLVVLVGGIREGSCRDLLLSLPPGARGLAVLVSPEDGPDDLGDLAAQAGWDVHVVSPRTSHRDVWRSWVTQAVGS